MDIEKALIDIHTISDELERLRAVRDHQSFFLLGMAKSGTTWFQQILNYHPQIICRGETNLNKRWARPLRLCIDQYNQKVSESGADKVYFGDVQSEFLYFCGVLQMMETWLQERGDDNIRFIGERTPNHMAVRIRTWDKYFPDCKFVHIIRDPRDVAVSACLFWTRRNPDNHSEQLSTPAIHFEKFIRLWTDQIDKCRAAAAEIPSRYLEVRYEDLINSPNVTLTKVFTFLDALNTEDIVENCLLRASFEKQTGRTRGDEDISGHKIRKGVVGDWVNYLDVESVLKKYGGVLEKYGY
jgi:hypothetical protein